MSQHNIIGSEAFDRRPFILVRGFRAGAMRRRRASTALAYTIVAIMALVAGAIFAALALAPQLADAEVREAGDTAAASGLPLTAPPVPGTTSTTAAESQTEVAAPATATTVANR